jgi:hypothetical protein
MHNCKASRDDLIEIALRADGSAKDHDPSAIDNCPACREELAALRSTLAITEAATQLVAPNENFWGGYHTRLGERLKDQSLAGRSAPARSSLVWMWRRLALTPVPVPAPLVLATLAFIVFSIFFMLHSRSSSATPATTSPLVVERTIEVPVIQEKLLTRVVYRNRQSAARRIARSAEAMRAKMAPVERDEATRVAQSLEGFKPVHEAKLTIIRGGRDEK